MKKWQSVIAGFILAFASLLGAPSAGAQDQPAQPERRLTISPLRSELEIKQGTSYTGMLELKNTGTKPLKVELTAEAFQVKNEFYDYTFLPDSPLNEWVHFNVSSITIASGQTYPVKYVVSVPLGSEPGGAYISLLAASLPDGDNNIDSVDRVGSLLYITVPGAITKTGSLINFSSPIAGAGTVAWSATLRNAGSAHFQSDYSATLKTLWGTDISSDSASSLILPRSVRVIQGETTSPTWLGLYILHYSISLGDNGQAIGTRPFLYLPLGQAIALLVLIISSVLFVRSFRGRRTRGVKPLK